MLCRAAERQGHATEAAIAVVVFDTLAVATSRLSTVGDRAFPVIAARVWNALPVDVISATTLPAFKRLLKTELFSRSFPDA